MIAKKITSLRNARSGVEFRNELPAQHNWSMAMCLCGETLVGLRIQGEPAKKL